MFKTMLEVRLAVRVDTLRVVIKAVEMIPVAPFPGMTIPVDETQGFHIKEVFLNHLPEKSHFIAVGTFCGLPRLYSHDSTEKLSWETGRVEK